jgi:hypothetical protein
MRKSAKRENPSATKKRNAPGAAQAVLWPRDVQARYGISPATLWRWEKAGRMPARDVSVSDLTGWYVATIEEYEARPRVARPRRGTAAPAIT